MFIHLPRLTRPIRITLAISLSIAGISLVTYSALGYIHHRDAAVSDNPSSSAPGQNRTPTASPLPTATAAQLANDLNGVLGSADAAHRQLLAIMIENHPDARPQAGLSSASVVYEAIAEGGITRFMAVFADPTVPVRVGPIRSARTYYVDLATELHAFYAHVGGNADALDQLAGGSNPYNLDEFSVGEPTFKRDFSRNVALEHTMYSSTEKLWDYAINTKHWQTTNSFSPWLFIDDAPVASRPASGKLTINFSNLDFLVSWEYNPTTNRYTRFMGGKPHTDANTGNAITASTIITQTVAKEAVVTRINEHGWRYTLTGSGKATITMNGKTIQATWKRNGIERTRYYAADGSEINLVRGQIWVEIIHSDVPTIIQ